MSYKYQGKKFLSLPEQVEVNKRNIEQLKRDEYRTFTTLLAIENLSYLELNQLVENSRDVSVGDLIYGSDAYYGQVTRVGGSVVEFTTVGLMPAGPKGDQGDQGPIGLTGPQGPQGIPGEVQLKDLPGYNLAMPDLTGKEYLGDGVYNITSNPLSTELNYNIYNGIYTFSQFNQSITGFLTINVPYSSDITISIEMLGTVTAGRFNVRLYNDGTIINSTNNFYFTQANNSVTYTYNNMDFFNRVLIAMPNAYNISNNQFKLQIEKGDTATPYTVPGQIPQYKIVGEE